MEGLTLVEILVLRLADVLLELIQTLNQIETKVEAEAFENTKHLKHCLGWYYCGTQ
jgi:hypothetical protein